MFWLKTLRPRQNGRHFPDDIFKWIFLNENVWISINISLKFVPRGPINNIPTLVQVMAWRRPGDKPLSEPMMVRLPAHICVTRPQWVNDSFTFILQNCFNRTTTIVKFPKCMAYIHVGHCLIALVQINKYVVNVNGGSLTSSMGHPLSTTWQITLFNCGKIHGEAP